jgi:outer membrane lipoprotein SlyB
MNATMTLPHMDPEVSATSASQAYHHNVLPTQSANTKPLWAAIGVLGICVLAMGASLVHIQRQPVEPDAQGLVPSMQQLMSPSGAAQTADEINKLVPKPAIVPENTAQPAIKSVAKPVLSTSPQAAAIKTPSAARGTAASGNDAQNAPAPASGPTPVQAQAQAAPICASCGTVAGVTAITREGQGSGVGAVAGGVVGAVLGNQVGQGNGRTAATILGAVGGGWAGNKIEKNVKKQTVYAVRVRMDDDSVRNFELAQAPAMGAKVTVDGNTLRSGDGGELAPAPAAKAKRNNPPATQPALTNNTYSGR